MIFLTVGHQVPFDRLVRLVDEWAGRAPGREVFAQIGDAEYRPRSIEFCRYLPRHEFEARLDACSRVVAHAGVGTIIQALLKEKPLLVLPRLCAYNETRSDHQVGTARHFAAQGQLLAAFDEPTFMAALDRFEGFTPRAALGRTASAQLIGRIKGFLAEAPAAARAPGAATPESARLPQPGSGSRE